MKSFWLCFVPLFVAVDSIGILPIFHESYGRDGFPENQEDHRSIRDHRDCRGPGFSHSGQGADGSVGNHHRGFHGGGSILLFVIFLNDVLATEKAQQHTVDADSLGAVPLGVPIISRPAVLTTSLLLINSHGFIPTAAAIVLNILLAGAIFFFSPVIFRFLGKTGAKTVSGFPVSCWRPSPS